MTRENNLKYERQKKERAWELVKNNAASINEERRGSAPLYFVTILSVLLSLFLFTRLLLLFAATRQAEMDGARERVPLGMSLVIPSVLLQLNEEKENNES